MATDYKAIMDKDGAIVVVMHAACGIPKDAILAILGEIGFDPSKVRFVEPGDIADCGDLHGRPVVIPMDDSNCDLSEMEVAGRRCANAGGRIAVLFGLGCGFEGLHPIADKYGTQCDWSADRLKKAVAGGSDAPRNSAGAPADRPAAHEVKCRK